MYIYIYIYRERERERYDKILDRIKEIILENNYEKFNLGDESKIWRYDYWE